MTELIHALILWARLVSGLRGWVRSPPPRTAALPALDGVPLHLVPVPVPVARRRGREWPPAPRSPYGLDTPLDGEETALVRPYLVEYEQRQERARQRRRRLARVLAADFGVDFDRHLVGARGMVS